MPTLAGCTFSKQNFLLRKFLPYFAVANSPSLTSTFWHVILCEANRTATAEQWRQARRAGVSDLPLPSIPCPCWQRTFTTPGWLKCSLSSSDEPTTQKLHVSDLSAEYPYPHGEWTSMQTENWTWSATRGLTTDETCGFKIIKNEERKRASNLWPLLPVQHGRG